MKNIKGLGFGARMRVPINQLRARALRVDSLDLWVPIGIYMSQLIGLMINSIRPVFDDFMKYVD